jgi:uncharacterized protein with FMN-binding domain
MVEGSSGRRIHGGLVSASGAAVLAVYMAGYLRTETAANRFVAQVAHRRVAAYAPRRVKSVAEGLHWDNAAASPSAPDPVPSVEVTPAAVPAHLHKDGTYTGWGFSRHGNIEAKVVIEQGRIASATISQCRTRYSCGVIDTLPPEVAQRQSPDVDYVSGATQSADAFYQAVVAALNKAR